jgi:class 3 adenylate cyclase/tetratricopeptide (TPR) repeat protein
MAACAQCGEQNQPSARFCAACGSPLPAAGPAAASARKTVTVLFCDVADSTVLGERLDPESLRRVMARWFDSMRAVLERHGGTVEKFIGDAVMAVFGVPQLHEDDALRAARAAADMRAALAQLNEEVAQDFGVELHMRIGINTGEVVAGDASTGHTLVTGDAVNTAKRLEQAARTGEILVGSATQRLVANAAVLEPREALTAKGKREPIEAFTLLAVIEGAPGYARRLDVPLVGRRAELAALREAFAGTVRERRCRLLTVIGPAGIGKSRLAAELAAAVRREALFLSGRCLPYGDGITFLPLRQVVREAGGLTGIKLALGDAEDLDLVVDRIRGAIAADSTPISAEETFWAVRRAFEALARRRPLVVCVEDIHWAEPTLLDLLQYVAGWTTDAPVLVLCLARPELLEEHPSWAVAPQASSLVLGPLSDPESEELLDALVVEWPLDAGARRRIAEAAEGNPLYVEQLVAMLAENGGIDLIPPTIHSLLAARLDRLSREERVVLERAAVAGKEFWRSAVAELSPEGERPDVAARLLALVRKDLIVPEASGAARDDLFRFRHVLIRDAAYAGIPKELRAGLHERFAARLERTAGEHFAEVEELVGYHLEQAYYYRQQLGPLDDSAQRTGTRAGELLARAGRRASARGDAPAAVSLLTRGAALLPDRAEDRLTALSELASALIRTGDFSRAESVLDEALERAAAAGNKQLELRTLIEREFFRTFTNPNVSMSEIVSVAEAAIPLLEELGDELGVAKAWWLLSEAHVISSSWGARAAALERALEHARKAEDRREESILIGFLAQALHYGPTPVQEAIARCDGFLADTHGDRPLQASLASTLAALHAMRGEFDEARTLWSEAHAIYDELGLRHRRAARSLIAATIEQLSGDPVAAERELRWGYETLGEMGERYVRSTLAAYLAAALTDLGRDDDARELTVESEANARADDLVTQVMWRGARGRVLARAGELGPATSLVQEAVELAGRTDFLDLQASAWLDLAQVLALARSPDATGAAARAKETYERKGNVVGARRADGLMAGVPA